MWVCGGGRHTVENNSFIINNTTTVFLSRWRLYSISHGHIFLPLVPDNAGEEVSGELGRRGIGMLGECPTTVVEANLHLEHVVAGRVGGGRSSSSPGNMNGESGIQTQHLSQKLLTTHSLSQNGLTSLFLANGVVGSGEVGEG